MAGWQMACLSQFSIDSLATAVTRSLISHLSPRIAHRSPRIAHRSSLISHPRGQGIRDDSMGLHRLAPLIPAPCPLPPDP